MILFLPDSHLYLNVLIIFRGRDGITWYIAIMETLFTLSHEALTDPGSSQETKHLMKIGLMWLRLPNLPMEEE